MTRSKEEIIREIQERKQSSMEKSKASLRKAVKSYSAGYDTGYYDALGELLEWIEE